MKKDFLKLLIIIFIVLIVFSVYKIGVTIYQNYEAKSIYNDLVEDAVLSEKEYPSIDFTLLDKNINSWIYLKGASISYPIVQGKDNDYYLNHLPNGSKNKNGSIYLDYRNNINFSDRHSIIYGHNTSSDSMFTNLLKYQNEDFYKNNPYYFIITDNNVYKVEIFSVYVASVLDDAWKLEFNDKDFNRWLAKTKDKSLFKSDVTFNNQDKVITLSTCNNVNNGRFVVVGILREYQ